jgi:splicing factor 3A subunit 3
LEEKLKDIVKEPVKAEALDLESYQSVQELEVLGMDRLKGALMALQIKCGGSLSERATRLFSLKGLERRDYPSKVRAKGFIV